MYANKLGRFLSVDPIMPNSLFPQTLNQYRYALNNPLRYIDKTGQYEEDVHRDLTSVLAYAAGFNDVESELIGSFSYYPDLDPEMEPFSSYSARLNFHFTSLNTRNGHWNNFTKAALGAFIFATMDFSNKSFWGDFASPAAIAEARVGAISKLGVFIHAFQDSYSHKGFTALIGHALSLSAPDKTYNNPQKANEMARETYNRLVEASKKMGDTMETVPFDDSIGRYINQFSRARSTKAKKKILGDLKNYITQVRFNRTIEKVVESIETPWFKKTH